MPLLANDPHLGIQMPSIWYEIGLHCAPKTNSCPYDLVGFTFPGAPGVVIGHNDHIAWGFTNEGPDSMDLYVERVDPADPNRYEVDGSWEQMEVRTETIDVAGGDPVEVEVRSTRHGPVISGVFGAADDFGDGGIVEVPDPHVLALRWTALEPSRIVDTILGLGTARDWAEFRVAVSYWDIAAQNVVYADVDGNIGYQATGRVPVRSRGDGRYPAPGWTSDHEWTGFIPFDELPRSFNPASGMIVTANQPVADEAYPYFIHRDTAYGYRADRIRDLLQPLDDATIGDLQAIQLDTFDGSAPFVLSRLLAIEPADESVATLQETLSTFPDDGYRMDAGSAAAAAYAAVWRHLLADTFDELPEDRQAGGNGRYFEVVRLLLEAPGDPWWDVVATPGGETRDDVLEMALSDAAEELADRLGSSPDGWRWGDIHIAEFENQSLGKSGIGVIEALFNRTAPDRVSGGSAIVDATGWIAPDGYRVVAVPSMRMVVDLADLSRSESIHTTGQSGHAYQRHYADMIERWTDGVTHPMRWTREQVDADAEHTLRLVPAG
jgi:penicillin amidase